QLAELPDRHEADPELVGDRCREDEAARFHPDHGVDLLVADLGEEPVNRRLERVAVLQKGGDVLKENPGFWKIRNIPNAASEVGRLRRHGAQISVSPK